MNLAICILCEGAKFLGLLRPAILDKDGEIIAGRKGDLHNDIISRQPMDWRLDNMNPTRGFTDGLNFFSRSEASSLLDQSGELHSERLKELQSLAA